ncbi:MAG: hypothetical protein KTR29_23145 [Rhodothermaceae bacterium]|nr:hypothetical protein [Rhodothermaceae bacterium]
MSHWFEVFDNERVQLLTRKQATRLIRMFIAAFAVTTAGIVMGYNYKPFFPLIIVGVFITWIFAIWWIMWRLRMLRRVAWCVKISDRKIEAYDYTRKKISMDWTKVQRVEINKDCLNLLGPNFCSFQIPQLFSDFAALSHRITSLAELYEIPIFIDGLPWQSLDVYELYPFLTEDAPQ